MKLPLNQLKKICTQYSINLLIIFGSYASDMFNEESDVDIAIMAENPYKILKTQKKLVGELSRLFEYRDIDLILLNHADPLLRFIIARKGKLVYEKEKGFFNIFKVRAMSEHNDAQKFYKLDKQFLEQYIERGILYGKQRVSPPKIK